jgi:glycerol uptake facilitator-like aquaporin
VGLATGVSLARGVFLEAFATGTLVASVVLLAADKRTFSKALAPVSILTFSARNHLRTLTSVQIVKLGIAAALYIGHMIALRYTGAALNRKSRTLFALASLLLPSTQLLIAAIDPFNP